MTFKLRYNQRPHQQVSNFQKVFLVHNSVKDFVWKFNITVSNALWNFQKNHTLWKLSICNGHDGIQVFLKLSFTLNLGFNRDRVSKNISQQHVCLQNLQDSKNCLCLQILFCFSRFARIQIFLKPQKVHAFKVTKFCAALKITEFSQCPSADSKKNSLPRPKTTTAWKLIHHRTNT